MSESNSCDFQLVVANVISQINNSITMEIVIDQYVNDVEIQVQLLDNVNNILVDYYTVDSITGSSKIIYFDLPSDITVCKIKTRLYQLVCFGDGSASEIECCLTNCEDCASKCAETISNPTWNLDGCVPVTISPTDVYYDNTDGKIPDNCPPTGVITLYIPKQLTMEVEAGCFGTVTTSFQYLPSSSVWGRVWTPTPPWENDYNNNPNSNFLSFSGDNLSINTYDLVENNDWSIPEEPGVIVDGRLKIVVRYREAYDDYTFVKAFGTSFTKQVCTDCLCSGVPGQTPITSTGPGLPLSDLYNSYQAVPGTNYGNCGSGESVIDILNNISVTVTGENSCRQPESCPASGPCPIETDINTYTQYDSCLCDKCYCDGGGRPIDIDILCGDGGGITYPQEADFPPSTESYTLWFVPRGDGALPVINNVLYDTGLVPTDNTVIIKIHTTSTPLEMREWVCKNLRFVTVLDRTKLSTDLNNAVISNWPYNDLYWDAKCDTYASDHPNDVPINLVPC